MQFGVAARCVTPDRPIYLSGYASRDSKSEGVYQDLFVKALAIRDGDARLAVIVTSDLLYFDAAILDPVEERLAREAGLRPAQLFLTASHTHCGPIIRQKDADLYGKLDEEYLDEVRDALVSVVLDAVAKLAPGRARYYRTRCDINVNRRAMTPGGIQMRPNPAGIIDRDVDIVTVSDPEGRMRAVLFGYACHATTMGGQLIGGDYPGFAQRMIQEAYPGAEALFVQGCAGDLRPNNVDEDDRFKSGPIEVVEGFGRRLGRAVLSVIDREGEDIDGEIAARDELVDLPLQAPPARADVTAALDDPSPHRVRWAQKLLDAMDRGDDLPTSVPTHIQTLTIGDGFALVAMAGEVCVEIGLRIKELIGERPRFVLGYTNRVHWYIPSRTVLGEGGYEADSYYYHGVPSPYDETVEDLLVDAAREMLAI